jgi:putative transposase
MPRIRRLVVPGYPHHVTQRGNRRQKTFFRTQDYLAYLEFIAAAKAKAGCDIWAYCLMPNHVHFVIVPQHESSLALLFKEAHRCYTRRINFREKWRGHLWQECFHSFVMDEQHLTSFHAHLESIDDVLVSVKPMLEKLPNWANYLGDFQSNEMLRKVRKHMQTGRLLGSGDFIETLESLTGRSLKPLKPGRKPIK